MPRHLHLLACAVCAGAGWLGHDLLQEEKPETSGPPPWSFHHVTELVKERVAKKRAYLRFMDHDTLSCGLYGLAKGSKDGQSPHALDEVYYVARGAGKFSVGKGVRKEVREVSAGAVIFVKRGVEHRFLDVTEDLEVVVFFSKAKVLKK